MNRRTPSGAASRKDTATGGRGRESAALRWSSASISITPEDQKRPRRATLAGPWQAGAMNQALFDAITADDEKDKLEPHLSDLDSPNVDGHTPLEHAFLLRA